MNLYIVVSQFYEDDSGGTTRGDIYGVFSSQAAAEEAATWLAKVDKSGAFELVYFVLPFQLGMTYLTEPTEVFAAHKVPERGE